PAAVLLRRQWLREVEAQRGEGALAHGQGRAEAERAAVGPGPRPACVPGEAHPDVARLHRRQPRPVRPHVMRKVALAVALALPLLVMSACGGGGSITATAR